MKAQHAHGCNEIPPTGSPFVCTSTKPTVGEICKISAELPESYKIAANHLIDFEPMLYNIWRQNAKTNEVSHFGNSEVRWMACYTQQEIAEALNVTQPTVAGFIKNSEFRKIGKNDDLADGSDEGGESDEAKPSAFAKRGLSAAIHVFPTWAQSAARMAGAQFR